MAISTMLQNPLLLGAGLSLLHFIWQGALLGVILWAILQLIDRRQAQLRYGLCVACLAIMAALPVFTAAYLVPMALEGRASLDSRVVPLQATGIAQGGSSGATGAQAPGGAAHSDNAASVAGAPASPAGVARARWQALATGDALAVASYHLRSWSYLAAPWLCLLWGAGVVLMAFRLAAGACAVTWLQRKATPVDTALRQELKRLAEVMGVRQGVRLLCSQLVAVPTLVGWVRPAILLPLSALTQLPPDQLRLLLAHELAHLSRGDHVVNLLQSLVETVLFYHPVVWWVSKQVRLEREKCCDDTALRYTQDALGYVEALAALASISASPHSLRLAANGGNLLDRIQRLLEPTPARPSGIAQAFSGAALLMLLAGFAWTARAAVADRYLAFPEDTSVGLLYIRDAGGRYNDSFLGSEVDEGWRDYAAAQGWVEVPAGTELMLRIPAESAESLRHLATLEADDLQKLDLTLCGLKDADLAQIAGLTGLKSLALNENPLTDAAFEHLKNMDSLVYLTVEKTGITGAAPAVENLRSLRYFDAWFTPFGDEGIRHLSRLPNLKGIGLEKTQVSAAGLAVLGEFPALEAINIEDTPADDAVLAALGQLPSLRVLSVARTPITDAGIAAVAKSGTLEVLDINNTAITDGGLEPLEGHPTLRLVMAALSNITPQRLAQFSRPDAAVPGHAQRSTNPDAPRVGVMFSRYTAVGPHWREKPYGYNGQDCKAISALLTQNNYDVYAIIEPGSEQDGEFLALLEGTHLSQKTIDGTNVNALQQLDAVVCKLYCNVQPEMLTGLVSAVRSGVGLLAIGGIGRVTPGSDDALIEELTGISGGQYHLGERGTVHVLQPHPVLGPLKTGDSISVGMIDGAITGPGSLNATPLIAAPQGAPENFYTLYTHQVQQGRVMTFQLWDLALADTPFAGRFDLYLRAINWVANRPVDQVW
jgi:beta-lactamase regulating signal transducer with metallopeptidase domain